jgi:hypothetical protein
MTAIVASDILLKLSAPGATTGNSVSGTPGNSWGNFISTTVLSNTPLDNLFTDITGAENAADQVDYACVFIHNNTASGNSMLNTVAWLPTSYYVSGGANAQLAADPTGASLLGSVTQQAVKITANTNAPAGVSGWISNTSTVPTSSNSYANGVYLGTIQPGYVYAIWVKRSATNSSPVNNDGAGIQINFDTMA